MIRPRTIVLLVILLGAIALLVLLLRQQHSDVAAPRLAGSWVRLPGLAPPPGRQPSPAPLGDHLVIDDELITWEGRELAYRLVDRDGLVLLEADFDGDGSDDLTVLQWRSDGDRQDCFAISFGSCYGCWRRVAETGE